MSQRTIVVIALFLFDRAKLYLRDITKVYFQSKTLLNRTTLAYASKEMIQSLPKGTIMKVIKPLNGIPETGTHWFHTYHKDHREKLSKTPSSYDHCFLISSKPGAIGIVGLHTDDTLFLGDHDFANLEEKELKNAKLIAKDVNELSPDQSLIFNGCKLVMIKGGINLVQNNQADRIKLIDPLHNDKRTYLEQRARGAYLATICQPEAFYSLSIASQCQELRINEISLLNKQLKWQLQNKDREIRFRPLQLESAKLFVFVDGSFANNKNFSSQIGFVIVWANETIK